MKLIRNNKFPFILRKNMPLIIVSMAWYTIIAILAGYLNIWEDEVYSLNTSSGSLSYAFHQSGDFEYQPPVYFLALTLWRNFSDSVLWARLLSVILIFTSQVLFYNFVKKIADRKIAAFFSILFILNPWVVYASLEIRTFALVIFLCLMILINFYNTYYIGNITTVNRGLLILFAVLGIFTQYYIGFLLFANAVVLLLFKKWRPLRFYILDMMIPLCLILIYIPNVIFNINLQSNSLPVSPLGDAGLFTALREVISQVTFGYFLPVDFIGSMSIARIFKGIIILAFFFSINYGEIKKSIREFTPFIIISLVIILFFVAVLNFISQYAVESKYTLVLFFPLIIIILFLFKALKPGVLNLWFGFFAVIFITVNVVKYKDLYKVKDFRTLGTYIEMNEAAGEPIFVHRNISAENLGYYYNGINEIIPVPQRFLYSANFGPEQWDIDEDDLKGLHEQFKKYPYFNVVIDNSPLRGVHEANTKLLNFLEQNFNLREEKPFKGRLDLYKFSDNNVFEKVKIGY